MINLHSVFDVGYRKKLEMFVYNLKLEFNNSKSRLDFVNFYKKVNLSV